MLFDLGFCEKKEAVREIMSEGQHPEEPKYPKKKTKSEDWKYPK
jgi:hypothetical protein